MERRGDCERAGGGDRERVGDRTRAGLRDGERDAIFAVDSDGSSWDRGMDEVRCKVIESAAASS